MGRYIMLLLETSLQAYKWRTAGVQKLFWYEWRRREKGSGVWGLVLTPEASPKHNTVYVWPESLSPQANSEYLVRHLTLIMGEAHFCSNTPKHWQPLHTINLNWLQGEMSASLDPDLFLLLLCEAIITAPS